MARKHQAGAFSEEQRHSIADGRCGPIQRFEASPHLATEAITPEALQPEHLDELSSLAEGCVESLWHLCLQAENAGHTDDDLWWIQSALVAGMTTGLRAVRFLNAGLEGEILHAYTMPAEISAGGMTHSNAHRLAAQLALDVVCRAWSEVYVAEGCKRQNVGSICTYRRSLVNMRPDQGGGFPHFKAEHVPAVADAVLRYCGADLRRVAPGTPRVLPWTGDLGDLRHWGLDATGIVARIHWENAKVKERQAGGPAATECFVTLQQAAAMVNRSKRTLEKHKAKMPAPRISDGGGKPDEWAWSELRPWLEKYSGRKLPARFPADQFRKD